MVKPNYKCTQAQLYSVCELGWQACQEHLTAFTDFSGFYKPALITSQVALVTAAENIPDQESRSEQREATRILLSEKAEDARLKWQRLKRYIERAFPESLQHTMISSAGGSYYEKALSENWDHLRSLLNAGDKFITDHLTELTANDIMPATFPAQFTQLRTDCHQLHLNFMTFDVDSRDNTSEKIEANNNIYKSLLTMFLDGQEIFAKDPETKAQFTFAQVLDTAGKHNLAGIKGLVTATTTGQPLADIIILSTNNTYTTETSADGRYDIKAVAAGSYTFRYSGPGYQDQIQEVIIKTGITTTLNIQMQPLPTAVTA